MGPGVATPLGEINLVPRPFLYGRGERREGRKGLVNNSTPTRIHGISLMFINCELRSHEYLQVYRKGVGKGGARGAKAPPRFLGKHYNMWVWSCETRGGHSYRRCSHSCDRGQKILTIVFVA